MNFTLLNDRVWVKCFSAAFFIYLHSMFTVVFLQRLKVLFNRFLQHLWGFKLCHELQKPTVVLWWEEKYPFHILQVPVKTFPKTFCVTSEFDAAVRRTCTIDYVLSCSLSSCTISFFYSYWQLCDSEHCPQIDWVRPKKFILFQKLELYTRLQFYCIYLNKYEYKKMSTAYYQVH